jgi:hypothetical protein
MLAMLMDAQGAGPGFAGGARSSASSLPCGTSVGGLLQSAVRGLQQVLRHSRHRHPVAISNRRLVAADDAGIAFRW